MYKRLFYFFAISSSILAAVMPFSFRPQNQLAYILALCLLSVLLLWTARSVRQVILGLILVLPILIYFNYIKLDAADLMPSLKLPHLSLNLSAALYLFLGLLFLLLWKKFPQAVKKAPAFYLILSLIGYTTFSLLWSDYKDISFPQAILSGVPFVVFFLCFWLVKSLRDYITLLLVLGSGALLPAALGLYQFITRNFFYTVDSSLGRIIGPFHHPNNFGIYLFLVISIVLSLLWSIEAKENTQAQGLKRILWAYLAVLVVALVLTYSRTSWISLLLFVTLFMVNRMKTLLKMSVFLALIFSLVMMFEAPRDRIMETFERSSFDSINARQTIFKIAYEKFQERPIVGYGVGSFEEQVRSVKENYESSSFPHNDLLLFTLEGGLVGALLFGSLSFVVLLKIADIWWRGRNFGKRQLGYVKGAVFQVDVAKLSRASLAIFLVSLIAGLAEATYRQVIFQIVLWAYIGGTLALWQNDLLPRQSDKGK